MPAPPRLRLPVMLMLILVGSALPTSAAARAPKAPACHGSLGAPAGGVEVLTLTCAHGVRHLAGTASVDLKAVAPRTTGTRRALTCTLAGARRGAASRRFVCAGTRTAKGSLHLRLTSLQARPCTLTVALSTRTGGKAVTTRLSRSVPGCSASGAAGGGIGSAGSPIASTSPTVPATTTATTTQGAVSWPAGSTVRALDIAAHGATLSWTPATGPVSSYVVRDAAGAVVGSTTGDDLEVGGLPSGSSQAWRVEALDATGTETTDGPRASARLLDASPAVDVTPTLDAAKGVQRAVYPGTDTTLTTTGADGTVYTLTIPKGALVGPETVTMTPIASMADSPIGFRAGVELEPSGLRFATPATLRIHPPTALTDAQIEREAPASSASDGTDLTPSPMLVSGDPDGTGAPARDEVLEVPHFSDVMVGDASAAQRNALLQSAQTAAERNAAAVAELIGADRTHQLTGKGEGVPDWQARLQALLDDAWTNAIKPLLDAARTDDAIADDAVSRAIRWDRDRQLLGLGGAAYDTRSAYIYDVLRKALHNRFDKAKARCLRGADVRALRDMLASERQLQLVGGGQDLTVDDLFTCKDQRLRLTLAGSTTVTAKGSGFSSQANDWNGDLHSASVKGSATGLTGTFDFNSRSFVLSDGTVSVDSGSVVKNPGASPCSATFDGQDHSGDADGYNTFTALVQPEVNPAPALADSVYVATMGVGDRSNVLESFPDGQGGCTTPADRPWRVLLGAGVRQGVHAALGRTTPLPKRVIDPVVNYTTSSTFSLQIDQLLTAPAH